MAAVAVSNVVTAYAVGMPLFDGLAFGEGLAVSLAGFVLVLAATLVPTLAALGKEPATVLAMGSESRGVSGLVFGGRLGRPATESGQQRKGQGGRECTLCTICRRFPL